MRCGWGEAAGFILEGCERNQAVGARELVRDGVEDPGTQGEAVRALVADDIRLQKERQFKRMGGQLGYRYSSSPIIVRDGVEEPPPTFEDYVPSAEPGNRAPHHWFRDGSSLYDHIGSGFTVLVLGEIDLEPLFKAADAQRVPLKRLEVAEPDLSELRNLYRSAATIVRSDHHVAWRGDALPADAETLVDTISGWLGWRPAS